MKEQLRKVIGIRASHEFILPSTVPQYQKKADSPRRSNRIKSGRIRAKQSREAGVPLPHLLLDRSFANMEKQRKQSGLNRSHVLQAVPKSLRPKPAILPRP